MIKCGSCGNSSDGKLSEISPAGGRFKYFAVQCTLCSVPFGLVEWDNITASIEMLEKKVNAMQSTISNIDSNLIRLAQYIQSRK